MDFRNVSQLPRVCSEVGHGQSNLHAQKAISAYAFIHVCIETSHCVTLVWPKLQSYPVWIAFNAVMRLFSSNMARLNLFDTHFYFVSSLKGHKGRDGEVHLCKNMVDAWWWLLDYASLLIPVALLVVFSKVLLCGITRSSVQGTNYLLAFNLCQLLKFSVSVWAIRPSCFCSPLLSLIMMRHRVCLSSATEPDSRHAVASARCSHRAANESVLKCRCCTHTRVCTHVSVLCLFIWWAVSLYVCGGACKRRGCSGSVVLLVFTRSWHCV